MLKTFCWAAALSVLLNPVITKAATQSSTQSSSDAARPACYVQTTDGRIINLERWCGQTSPTNTNLTDPNTGNSPNNLRSPSANTNPTANSTSGLRERSPLLRSGSGYAHDNQ